MMQILITYYIHTVNNLHFIPLAVVKLFEVLVLDIIGV